MDFAATVRLEDGGRKLVLIEIQKARSAWDVQRFRRYLGSNMPARRTLYLDPDGEKQALPIVTIYFLGEGLECVDVPVVKVNRHYLDAATGERGADHRSVRGGAHPRFHRGPDQPPAGTGGGPSWSGCWRCSTRARRSRSDPHLLDILEENFPERYREVLRRLMRAWSEQDIREGMDVEDEVLTTLQDRVREIEEKNKTIEQKDQALRRKDQALREKDQALERQNRLIEELQRRLDRD